VSESTLVRETIDAIHHFAPIIRQSCSLCYYCVRILWLYGRASNLPQYSRPCITKLSAGLVDRTLLATTIQAPDIIHSFQPQVHRKTGPPRRSCLSLKQLSFFRFQASEDALAGIVPVDSVA
jgi:hypothetical protein